MTEGGRRRGNDCAYCGGSGWEVVATDDSSFARRCRCFVDSDRERRLRRAGVPVGLGHCSFPSFETTHLGAEVTVHPKLKYAKAKAEEFIDSVRLGSRGRGLLFHGPAGTGKTHLAVAIVATLATQTGLKARFLDFRGLLKTIQESWNATSESSEKQVLDDILDADVLALDDLGAEKSSAWVRETVGYLINERYVRAKPVVITTNLHYDPPSPDRAKARNEMAKRSGLKPGSQPDSLEDRIGVATLSRLYEMCIPVDMNGLDDYRQAHANLRNG